MGIGNIISFKSQDSVKNSIIKETEKFKKSLVGAKKPEEEYHKLAKIVNSFFEKLFSIHYKFTYEDLKFEVKEKNLPPEIGSKIDELCDRMNEMDFDKSKITKDNLLEVSAFLTQIAEMTSNMKNPGQESHPNDWQDISKNKTRESTHPEKERKSFFSKLFGKINKEQPQKEQKLTPPEVPEMLPSFSETGFEPPGSYFSDDVVEVGEPESIPVKETGTKIVLKEKEKGDAFVVESRDKEKEHVEKRPKQKRPVVEHELPRFNIKPVSEPIKDVTPKKIRTEKKPSKKLRVKKIKLVKPIVKTKVIPPVEPPGKREKLQPGIEVVLKKDLRHVIKDIERNKKQIAKGIEVIESQEKLLREERREIRKKDESLPEFKIFKGNIEHELVELEQRKEELKKTERALEEKKKSISEMEKHLSSWAEKLKNDEAEQKKAHSLIHSKEKLIAKIKEELNKKYEAAKEEIEGFKQELKEKQESFMKLQRFYRMRENRLSVEEENLLNEKRRYAKFFSELLAKHIAIANRDLANVEARIKITEKKHDDIESKIKGIMKKSKDLMKIKEEAIKEAHEKRLYFDSIEKEFRAKDPEFEKMSTLFEERQQLASEREISLSKIESQFTKGKEELRQRQAELEVKEMDLQTVEKEIDRFRLKLESASARLALRERQLEKRIASYQLLKSDIARNIARERRNITKLENKVRGKSSAVSRGLYAEEKRERATEEKNKMEKQLIANEYEDDLKLLKNISVSHDEFEVRPGEPVVLDILRLLNMAKGFISRNENQRARDAYIEIQRRFEELDEEDRESIYGEIVKVFKERKPYSWNQDYAKNENIDSLLSDFQACIDSGDFSGAAKIYSRIQEFYLRLPKDEKGRYYPRIMELYNKALDYQNTEMAL